MRGVVTWLAPALAAGAIACGGACGVGQAHAEPRALSVRLCATEGKLEALPFRRVRRSRSEGARRRRGEHGRFRCASFHLPRADRRAMQCT